MFALIFPMAALLLSLTACVPTPGNGEIESAASSSVVASAGSSEEQAMVTVLNPLPGAVVTSPLTVTGEARGNWYFEASFPVRLYDGNGTEIALGIAQAQSDWMTTDFVPFLAQLIFTPPATATGTLVLEKDNPSGLPENADFVTVPVAF